MHKVKALLLMPSISTQNSRQNFLKIFFPQQQKRMDWTMISFIKIQSENMKMTWNIRLFISYMICNFSKCDDFTVL